MRKCANSPFVKYIKARSKQKEEKVIQKLTQYNAQTGTSSLIGYSFQGIDLKSKDLIEVFTLTHYRLATPFGNRNIDFRRSFKFSFVCFKNITPLETWNLIF